MGGRISWFSSMKMRLLLGLAAAAVAGGVLVYSTSVLLTEVQGRVAAVDIADDNQTNAVRILVLIHEMSNQTPVERKATIVNIRGHMANIDRILMQLRKGDTKLGILPPSDPTIIASVEQRSRIWHDQVTKSLMTTFDAFESNPDKIQSLRPVAVAVDTFVAESQNGVALYRDLVRKGIAEMRKTINFAAAIVGAILVLVTIYGNGIGARIQRLQETAAAIAGGNLEREAPISGADEVAQLGRTFNKMTKELRAKMLSEEGHRNLKELLKTANESVVTLTSASNEILAASSQQASSASETSAAVSETVATVEEVVQTSEQSLQRARDVVDVAKHAADVGEDGRSAIEASLTKVGDVQRQMETTAQSVLALSEKAQSISEIIATVTDIAEQTNILAINAGIEATRAGEQGAGFGFVAKEIKDLADEAKESTRQIRHVLADIQKGTNDAVLMTERGAKGANDALHSVEQAGGTIAALAETIGETARVAAQIVASTTQQLSGVSQIHEAMRDIEQSSNQALVATRQTEQAASEVNGMAADLRAKLQEFVS